MKKTFTGWVQAARLALAAGLLAIAPQLSHAGAVRIDRAPFSKGMVLSINGMPVASLVSGAGPLSIAQRIELVQNRLLGWAKEANAPDFTAGKVNGAWGVVVQGAAVLAPSHAEAARAGLSRRALAHRWAALMASAWRAPFLTVSASKMVVGVGDSRWLRVGGGARGPVTVSLSPSNCADTRVNANGWIQVLGRVPARATLAIQRAGETVTTQLNVMKPAGAVTIATVEVTGNAVPADLISSVLENALRGAIRLEPGAWSVLGARPRFPPLWTRGDHLRYAVPVRLAGPNYLTVATAINLKVVRRHLNRARNISVFYSNKPERVMQPQVLFHHVLGMDAPARLLYHHQNMSMQPLRVAVDVANDGDHAVPLQVVDANGDPNMNTVLVGHEAAFRYLKRSQSGTGVIVNLPAHGTRRVYTTRLNSGDTLSGLMLLRPLAPGPLYVRMAAEDMDRPLPPLSAPDTNMVFPAPDQTVDVSYAPGGPWAYVPLGGEAVRNPTGQKLDGNYGVLYTVRLHLSNPTAVKQTVRVLFEPRAGEARGAFLINGELTETASAFPPSEVRVTTLTLAPGQKRSVTIVTMPAAGGSYPAALIVHG